MGDDETKPFTAADARADGRPPSYLRRKSLERISRGWYVERGPTEPSFPLRCAQLLDTIAGDAALSHWSAATLLGLPSRRTATVHVTLSPRSDLPDRREFAVHGRALPESDIGLVADLRTTRAERVYLDLAEYLPLHELVALGDAALSNGLATPHSLEERVAQVHRRRGIVLARDALRLLDGRADSPPESFARVWLTRAGLPPPTPQQPVYDPRGRLLGHCDLGYEEWKTGLEYEGGGHAEPGQFEYDIGRYTAMTAAGWTILRFSRRHLRAGGAGLVTLTLDALRLKGYPG